MFKHNNCSACCNFYAFNKYSFISFFCCVVFNSFAGKFYYASRCLYSLHTTRCAIRNFCMLSGYFILFCTSVGLGVFICELFWHTVICTLVVDVIWRHTAVCDIYFFSFSVLFICYDRLQFVYHTCCTGVHVLLSTTRAIYLFFIFIVNRIM